MAGNVTSAELGRYLESLGAQFARERGIKDAVVDETALKVYTMPNALVRWLFHARLRLAASCLAGMEAPRVLDFGCGTGMLFPYVLGRAGKVYATDLVLDYASAVVEHFALPVQLLAARDWESLLPDDSLDAVFALDCLEHNEDISGLLAAYHRKLNRGGRLVVSGPTENVLYRLGRRVSGIRSRGEYHKQTIRTISTEIERSGFRRSRRWTLPFPLLPGLFWVLDYRVEK